MLTMNEAVFEHRTEKAIVRIHPGKLTEDQRRAVLEDAGRTFFRAIQRVKQGKAGMAENEKR